MTELDWGFFDYMTIGWFLANLITSVSLVWVAWELNIWCKALPYTGTGFRALSKIFMVVLALSGVHHILAVSLVWQHPTPFYMVAVDGVLAVISGMLAYTLFLARDTILNAWKVLLKHRGEWASND